MSAALAVQRANGGPVGVLSQMSSIREKIDTIKQTVARGATDAQLEMFLSLCERYSLDPFLKELWFVQGVGVVTSRDGYLKVAQRDPDFDGIVSAAVCEGDDFEIDPMTPTVKHKYGVSRGPIIGAYAVVFHKQRRPCLCFAPIKEYRKSSQVWNTYTTAMICKVAEVQALKRQFGISGLVTEEEIGHQPTWEEGKAAQQEVAKQKIAELSAGVIDVQPITDEDIPASMGGTYEPEPGRDRVAEMRERHAEAAAKPTPSIKDVIANFQPLKQAFAEIGKPMLYYDGLNREGCSNSQDVAKKGPKEARRIYKVLAQILADARLQIANEAAGAVLAEEPNL